MTIEMTKLLTLMEAAVCTPKLISCGKIATATLSTKSHKAVTITVAVVVVEAVIDNALTMPASSTMAKVEETKDKANTRMLDAATGQTTTKIITIM